MKRFQFPLDRVRQFRKLQLESEQARLEEMLGQLRSVERMEQELARQSGEAAEEVRSREGASAVVPTGQISTLAGFRSHVSRVGKKISAHKQEVLARIDRQRQSVAEARQRYETLEQGRENALAVWRGEFAREQENTAAELFLARMSRDRRRARAVQGSSCGNGDATTEAPSGSKP